MSYILCILPHIYWIFKLISGINCQHPLVSNSPIFCRGFKSIGIYYYPIPNETFTHRR
jgi:hypothetical protein